MPQAPSKPKWRQFLRSRIHDLVYMATMKREPALLPKNTK
ncbi:hypothetical protein JCM19238_5140 [Vibrio ponticus]|nr:hypothetical protein JCM19238_5140 [Vibrio ponticus]